MTTTVVGRRSPYKGLIPYNEGDAPFFFGRDKETRLIIANLFASPLTLLYGASGVGKSSVLRAGAVHQLRQRDDLLLVPFSAWQSNPLSDLMQAIADYAERADPDGWRRVAAVMEDAQQTGAPLSLSALLAVCYEQTGRRLMLILDQFEEYFLYHPQDDAFADEFPKAVLQTDAPVSFLISIREDSLAKLDRFEGRIPGLFDNYLRIEHLGYDAARDSIIKPVERFNELRDADAQPVSVEPSLVAAVLDQVQTGQVILGEAGRGRVKTDTTEAQIETPFLQMVMTRLWDEEQRVGSTVLRLATLDALGGAERIVRTHLDATMSSLAQAQQDIAAKVFHYLVTPSGTKIAHTVPDLSEYAGLPRAQLASALEELAGSDTRILRGVAPPPDQPGESRYEIFHDVLAAAILDWRSRHVQAGERAEAERLAEEQRREAEERARVAEKVKSAGRLRWLSVALALMTLLAMVTAAYALKQRSLAVGDAARAQEQAKEATEAKAIAIQERGFAEEQRIRANDQASLATEQTKKAEEALEEAEEQRQRADEQAALARSRATEADKAKGEAVAARGVAETERQRANQQAAIARSRELAAAARSNLNSDPELSVLLALRAVAESTGGNLTEVEKQGITETDRKEAIEALHEAVQASRVRHTLAEPNSAVETVAYGLMGARVITVNHDKTVKLWDANSGQLLRDLSDKKYREMALSHDELRMAIAVEDGTVKVWDLARGEIVQTLEGSSSDQKIEGMVFSNDDSTLAIARSTDLRLWNITTGEAAELPYENSQPFEGSWNFSILRDGIELLTFTDDGKTLVAGGCVHSDRAGCTTLGVKFWDVATRRESRKPVAWEFGNFNELRRAFSPNGERLFTMVKDGTAKVWDTTSGKELFDLSKEKAVFPAAFSSDGGTLSTMNESESVMLWDVSAGKARLSLDGQIGKPTGLAFSPEGNRLAAFSKGMLKMWDADSGVELLTLSGHKDVINSVAFSPDGEFIATASDDRTTKMWDITPSKELLTLYESELGGLYAGVMFSADGTRLSIASYDSVKQLDSNSGKELRSLDAGSRVYGFDYSPDGKLLAAALSDGKVKIWDTTSGQNTLVISDASSRIGVYAVAFSADGKLLATGSDMAARIWDATTGKELHNLSDNLGQVFSVAFSPDGQYLATTSAENLAKLWDVKTGKLIHTLGGQTELAWKVAFSPDGKLLATASSNRSVNIWDVQTGRPLTDLSGHTDSVYDVAFSPDGKLIATASEDKTVKVWDASTGLELLSLTGHDSGVGSLAFSPDGLRLVTSAFHGKVRVYTLDPQKLIKLAQERVSRHELTAEERKKYLHESPEQ